MTPRRSRAQRAADPSVEHDNPLSEVYEDQLQSADMVVLNKTDLLDAATIATPAARDRWHGRRARCGWCRHARAGWIRPCCSGWARRRRTTWRRARPTTTRWTAPTSTMISRAFVVPLPEIRDRRSYCWNVCIAASEAHDILRIKGFAAGHAASRCGWPCRASAAASASISTSPGPPGAPREGMLVVIGQKGLDRDAIAAELAGRLSPVAS